MLLKVFQLLWHPLPGLHISVQDKCFCYKFPVLIKTHLSIQFFMSKTFMALTYIYLLFKWGWRQAITFETQEVKLVFFVSFACLLYSGVFLPGAVLPLILRRCCLCFRQRSKLLLCEKEIDSQFEQSRNCFKEKTVPI